MSFLFKKQSGKKEKRREFLRLNVSLLKKNEKIKNCDWIMKLTFTFYPSLTLVIAYFFSISKSFQNDF